MNPLSKSAHETQIAGYRQEKYNATVESLRLIHDELMIVRVRPDGGMPDITPGQYATLGAGVWETRVDNVDIHAHDDNRKPDDVVRRAYSLSCSLMDENKQVVRCSDCDYLEFYIALVRRPSDDPPPLTPRLFALKKGDRLFMSEKVRGSYTLENVKPTDNIIFAGTGTGEAPHNAMLANLLVSEHQGQILNISCVRYKQDAAYLDIHRELEKQHSNYNYLALTTREPENTDVEHKNYVGKQYIQDFLAGEVFGGTLGWTPEPGNTHVFLCGNPSMIGLPRRNRDKENEQIYPEPMGAIEVLANHGFVLETAREEGNIHVEKYW